MTEKSKHLIEKESIISYVRSNDSVIARKFHLYECAVALEYETALANEPNLRASEWERRNPFVETIASAVT